MPKFRIKGVATIRARSMLFCNGEVLGGKVAVGQRVLAPVGLPPIAAIEFALLSEPSRHEEPALGFRFVSEDECANLLRLLRVGTELVLADDGDFGWGRNWCWPTTVMLQPNKRLKLASGGRFKGSGVL